MSIDSGSGPSHGCYLCSRLPLEIHSGLEKGRKLHRGDEFAELKQLSGVKSEQKNRPWRFEGEEGNESNEIALELLHQRGKDLVGPPTLSKQGYYERRSIGHRSDLLRHEGGHRVPAPFVRMIYRLPWIHVPLL